MDFLPLLLGDLESGLTLTQIAKKHEKSKQALNYHIKRLRRNGLITRVQSYPYSIYKITPLGSAVKQKLIYPDTMKPTWKCHALQVGFKIEDFGSYNLIETKTRTLTQMNGWKYTGETISDHHVKIQETGLMIISCPDTYTEKPDQAFADMYSKATKIAQAYCDRYNMKLKPMQIIRRGQKSILGSERLAKLFGKGKFTDKEWVDASGGTDELETYQENYRLEDLLEVPERLKNIESNLIPELKWLTENIQTHRQVLSDIGNAIKELNDTVKKLSENNRSRESNP